MSEAQENAVTEDVQRRAWDDWLNPILVKEVRQALRGRYFKFCFWITLLVTSVVSAVLIVEMGDTISTNDGRNYFFGIFICLIGATMGFVPFAAFNSMGAEWDENTFDLLIISNMKPGQIVAGKLLSATIQSVLFFSAFTPFIVFSSLLKGVDLSAVATSLYCAAGCSLVLSLIAVCLSTLSRVRFARIVLMAALAGVLILVIALAAQLADELMRRPATLREPEFVYAVISMTMLAAVLSLYSYFIAANMLAHVEENRSTGLRVLTSGVTLAFLVWLYYSVNQFGFPPEASAVMTMIAMGVVMVPSTFFATEPEALGRRVAPHVPRNPLVSALISPWMPGGARGMLYATLHLVVLLGGFFLIRMGHAGGTIRGEGYLSVIGFSLYLFVYLALPSGLLCRYSDRPSLRAAARAVVPFMVATFAFMPALLGYFIGDRDLMNMEHPGNPFHLVFCEFERHDPSTTPIWFLLFLLVAVGFAINVPRMLRAFSELSHACRSRSERERAESERTLTEQAVDAVPES